MAVHVDPSIPIHPLTVEDLDAMVAAGILAEDARVELLDGVLVEVSPPGPAHIRGLSHLLMLAVPAAASAGFQVTAQDPLVMPTSHCLPEPDLAIVRATPRDRRPDDAVLVVEVSVSSRAVDLGRKAAIYANAGIPEYWVLDVEGRALFVHLEPQDGRYGAVTRHGEEATVTASRLPLVVPVGALL